MYNSDWTIVDNYLKTGECEPPHQQFLEMQFPYRDVYNILLVAPINPFQRYSNNQTRRINFFTDSWREINFITENFIPIFQSLKLLLIIISHYFLRSLNTNKESTIRNKNSKEASRRKYEKSEDFSINFERNFSLFPKILNTLLYLKNFPSLKISFRFSLIIKVAQVLTNHFLLFPFAQIDN